MVQRFPYSCTSQQANKGSVSLLLLSGGLYCQLESLVHCRFWHKWHQNMLMSPNWEGTPKNSVVFSAFCRRFLWFFFIIILQVFWALRLTRFEICASFCLSPLFYLQWIRISNMEWVLDLFFGVKLWFALNPWTKHQHFTKPLAFSVSTPMWTLHSPSVITWEDTQNMILHPQNLTYT